MMNSRLKAMFSFKSKITLYIPSTVDVNKEIDNKVFVDRAASLLSNLFGGLLQLKPLAIGQAQQKDW